jgi:DNA repair ATPase RecN
MTIGEQKTYSDNIKNAQENLSDNDIDENIINDIIQDTENLDIDSKKMSEFVGAISNLDLTAEEAVDEITALAHEYGIDGEAFDNLLTNVNNLD